MSTDPRTAPRTAPTPRRRPLGTSLHVALPGMEPTVKEIEWGLWNIHDGLTQAVTSLTDHLHAASYGNGELDLHFAGDLVSLVRVVRVQDEKLRVLYEGLAVRVREMAAMTGRPRRFGDAVRKFRLDLPDQPQWREERFGYEEIEETLLMATSPLLGAEGGRLFIPTAVYLQRYKNHSTAVQTRHRELYVYSGMLLGALSRFLESGALRGSELPMEQIDALHHSDFEQLLADLLVRDGYRILRSGGGAGDMGADVLAVDEFGRHIMVQAKHFTGGTGSVGQPVAQHLYGGAMAAHPGTLAVLVTNGRITGGAKVWAKEKDRVRLVDREGLDRWSAGGEAVADVIAP